MNDLAIIIPGILNFLCWFIHLNATRRMSILKFILFLLISICPLFNIIVLALFIMLLFIGRYSEGVEVTSEDSGYPFGFQVEYDDTTLCGKLLTFLTKNR